MDYQGRNCASWRDVHPLFGQGPRYFVDRDQRHRVGPMVEVVPGRAGSGGQTPRRGSLRLAGVYGILGSMAKGVPGRAGVPAKHWAGSQGALRGERAQRKGIQVAYYLLLVSLSI